MINRVITLIVFLSITLFASQEIKNEKSSEPILEIENLVEQNILLDKILKIQNSYKDNILIKRFQTIFHIVKLQMN
ncbi:hypothetical protein [Aliarcobacter skirrowii]|uniref:hypothetical protein n=1 Tax=Aliarcobacter skirrowii TaxID=28200 RepID=UPI0029BC39A5|nr:hypothetical protein [Aliarcobacter skirrowii]MDX4039597.1 hypothetical protein [Aliarcobacter skirrowii]